MSPSKPKQQEQTDSLDTDDNPKRQYHSPKRKQQSAKTRDSIIEAGAQLVQEFTAWDWRQLTFRAVSERAGVSERTVYRYFPTESKLKTAVMQFLVKEAGVELQEMKLEDFADIVANTFDYLSSFAIEPTETPDDPTFVSIDAHRRISLHQAVADATPDWTEEQQEMAAAALDIFWNLPPFERLTLAWGFDLKRAIGTVEWVVQLIEKAIKEGQRPA